MAINYLQCLFITTVVRERLQRSSDVMKYEKEKVQDLQSDLGSMNQQLGNLSSGAGI